MKRLVIAVALVLGMACKPDPEECTQKGDEKACNALCSPDTLSLCYEMRTRKVEACLDKDVDCAKACALWKETEGVAEIRRFYIAKLRTDERVASIGKKCVTQ